MAQFRKTAIALGVAQMAWMYGSIAMAQTATQPAAQPATQAAPADKPASDPSIVVVTGQRAALRSAQKIKQDSDEVMDSIASDDIGKLPDRSVTEVLQRVTGVTIDHTMAASDPEHFSVEGSGVQIRGLSYVRSELNGRDEFSANGGRALNFEDVPPELMAGVDVYKNPSAEQIEGAIGGLVNLRTAMPFDFKGLKGAFSLQESYSSLMGGSPTPSFSALLSNRWSTDAGQFGALIDVAHSESKVRTDAYQAETYYPLTTVVPGQTVWIPKGVDYRTLDFDRKRDGLYGALEWKNSKAYSSLTFFDSHYDMQWNENALFSQANAYNITASNATYAPNGNLISGTLSDSADGGINFGDDTRTANRISDTKDLSWKLRVRASDRWTLTSDTQYIYSRTKSFDSTVGAGIELPSETVNLSGTGAPRLSFSASDIAYMANPNNYYWAYTMEHFDEGTAREFAWKGDAKFDFDDPILRDLRFGVRLTDRNSLTQNSNPGYNWAAITQPWQIGWDITGLAYMGDPRFSGGASLHSFNNFFNGGASVPALVFPNVSTTTGFPSSYAALHNYTNSLCVSGNTCGNWNPATFGTDPSGNNSQSEQTEAAYSQLRFEFDNLKYPVDGNVGLRYVLTQSVAHGYVAFTPSVNIPSGSTVTGVTVPSITAFAKEQDFSHSYVDALPSLNLRMKTSDQLQFRFAYSTAISRPDPSQMQAYTTLSEGVTSTTTGNTVNVSNVNLSGVAVGNPMLSPVKTNQVDLTAEWYFSPVGSLTFAVFDKRLKDIIINETFNYAVNDNSGTAQNFSVTGPINGASGTARGFELAYQQYFDMLPGWWSGFGVQGNFTYVDSHEDLYSSVTQAYCTGSSVGSNLAMNLNGCDTNGQTFGNLPLQGLSRRSYNLALLYDKGPFSARLAYNWRSKYLQAVNVNPTQGSDGLDTNPASPTYGQHNVTWGLPIWAGDYGQLDMSASYKITDDLSIVLEAQNINNAIYTQLMQQHNGLEGRAWFATGPRYNAQLRYSF